MSPRGKEGIRAVSADIQRRKDASASVGGLWFKLPNSGDSAQVRFLENGDEIAWCMVHEVPVEGRSYGKRVLCLDQEKDGTPCPGCERDLPRQFRGFINLIWFDAPSYKRDSSNKLVRDSTGDLVIKGHKDQVATWGAGIRLFEELDEVDANFKGLKSRLFKVKRKGSGLETKYVVSPVDIDAGMQPMGDKEKELAKGKADLSRLTTPGSYEDFMRELGESVPRGHGNGQNVASRSTNPFKRNR